MTKLSMKTTLVPEPRYEKNPILVPTTAQGGSSSLTPQAKGKQPFRELIPTIATRIRVRSDLLDWMGAIPNPACTHLESFPHMQQASPRTADMPITIKEDSQESDKGSEEEEEYGTGSKTESDLPPPIPHKMTTQATTKTTPRKAIEVKTPQSQTGKRVKKVK